MSDEPTVRPEDGPGSGGSTAQSADGIPAYARPAVRLLPGAMTDEPDDDAPVPGRRRKAMLITIGALGVAALLSAVFVGPTAWRVVQQKDSTLTMPDRIGDLTRDDSDAAKDTAGYLMTALAADIDLDRTASAIYSDPAGGPSKSIMVFGGGATLLRPEREFDTVLKLMEDETGGVTALQSIDPGELGGVVKCGSADSTDGQLAVCGWADNGSIALALFPNRTPAEATPLILQIRTTTLHR
ncbi:hypothetical protein Cs7R123_27940 [Catellatospora sp. TT07R-123]|uniref:hypothetical protein n=1 Tax=Catellatospora sp. TT07R-123 TaxID=2733863 RepID=UPI001AFD12CD|nr:hypothetical protein [Catellatospora sp. TT07R-123]GHJ45452.1 hypothetical protein Cs7R123_27940 [Catellatospora sp. TT07R-123]